ncbi:hypothetical protein DPEC_G00225620 [Dallia pectoralis]|uniref:Uncharacterized protein n=1 Tax=Dallia pectoralis TaxID=75939 RepID=A0ACC2G0L8_DALPE|nr:hypothetical protein DPEC_G00225620 [Dallia pectoralis]
MPTENSCHCPFKGPVTLDGVSQRHCSRRPKEKTSVFGQVFLLGLKLGRSKDWSARAGVHVLRQDQDGEPDPDFGPIRILPLSPTP